MYMQMMFSYQVRSIFLSWLLAHGLALKIRIPVGLMCTPRKGRVFAYASDKENSTKSPNCLSPLRQTQLKRIASFPLPPFLKTKLVFCTLDLVTK